jgi:hypothetical protein
MKVYCVIYDGPAVGVASVWLDKELARRDCEAEQARDDANEQAKERFYYSVDACEVSYPVRQCCPQHGTFPSTTRGVWADCPVCEEAVLAHVAELREQGICSAHAEQCWRDGAHGPWPITYQQRHCQTAKAADKEKSSE